MKSVLWLAVLGTAFLLGCGAGADLRVQSVELDTARLQDRLSSLERNQARLTTLVDSLTAAVREQVAVVRQERGDSSERIVELEGQIGALQAALTTSQAEWADLKDKVTYSGRTTSDGGDGALEPSDGSTPRQLYDAAYQDLTRGNHALALMGFQEVLAQFGESELADNAQYWIGETYYVQEDYETALSEFRKLPIQFPTADKVPAAMLKVGFCLVRLGEKGAAAQAFQDLIDRFPTSEEARLADQKLGDL